MFGSIKYIISYCMFFNIIAVLFYTSNCLASNSSDGNHIIYKIEQAPSTHKNCIHISGIIKGNSSGSSLLRFPRAIKNIKMTAHNKIINSKQTDHPTVLEITYPKNENINFSYGFCQENPSRVIDYTIIEPELIYFPIRDVLITPEIKDNKKIKIKMDLESLPKSFKVASSFNVNNRSFEIQEYVENFCNSFISAGKLEIDNFSVKGKPVYIVTNGKWDYFKKPASFYLEKLINSHRSFWNDYDFPVYTVFLIKQNEPYVPKVALGAHWYNSFSGLMPEDKKSLNKVLYILSHEIFHDWLSQKMQISLPQGNLQWFIEGFNDYYGLYLPFRNSIIDFNEYIEIYNILLKDYWLSPAKSATNEKIFKKYFNRGHYSLLAQLRGHFAAKELRDKFNQDDTNKFDLAMKALFENQKKEGWKYLTEDKIDETFISYVGKKEWDKTKHMIKSGELLTFSPTAFMPYAKLEMVDVNAPIFGFNELDLLDNNIISNLDENSNAYKAGLRNGQNVHFYSIDFKSFDKPLTIQIDDNSAIKTITFLPNVTKKKIPQYVMVKGDVLGKRMRDRE